MTTSKTVLVTGATGFIGRVLCTRLHANGSWLRVASRSERKGPWDEVVISDLTNPLSTDLMHEVSTVFHLAGKAHALSEKIDGDTGYHQVNVLGTKALLESAKQAGVTTFVYFSSVKARGDDSHHCQDESSVLQPDSAYGKSKLAAENLVLNGGYVDNPVVIRPTMVYGSTEKGNLPKMIRAVQEHRFPPLPMINNQRSMVHVDDLVTAAILASEDHSAAGETYIVTDGQQYSINQIYEWVCDALDQRTPSWHVPVWILRILGRAGDWISTVSDKRFIVDTDSMNKLLNSACYSSRKIETQLGFKPKHHLRESIPHIVKHLTQRYHH